MRAYWMLRGGESIEVYDGAELAPQRVVVYRIGVERFYQAEVKIVRPNANTKILAQGGRSSMVDVAVVGALFLEVIGLEGIGEEGWAFGWYEVIGES